MRTVRMTMAQALVRFLAQQHVSRDGVARRFINGVLGIFGHGNVTGLGQALEEVGGDLPYSRAQNEQAMVHTASAYAKLNSRLQTLACTSSVGPGATNMITGAATATVNRLPVLLLPGDTFASRLPHPVLQQLEHPMHLDVSVNDALRPVSRFWDRITRPEQLLASLPEAMRILADQAETGAVTLAMPEDVQTEAYDYPAHFFERRVHSIPRLVPATELLREAVVRIRSAARPLIVAGGGAIYSEASPELAAFATEFGIPVAETQAGKGALPWNHPWNVGPVGSTGGLAANRLAAQADCVVALGTRLADFTTASHTAFQHPEVRFLGVNVGAMDAHKMGGLPLIGDARATLRALGEGLRTDGPRDRHGYGEEIARLKALWDEEVDRQRAVTSPAILTQANLIGIVNDASGPRDVVVCAAGGMPGDLLKLWRPLDPKGYHVEYGYSCMGYEIAGGLGAKMADPSREVYVLVGDGSYLMLHTEIVTSILEGYKLIIVVVDNGGFQCIRSLQTSCGSPAFGNELRRRNPATRRLDGEFILLDFAKNAESLGAKAYRATTGAELREALQRAQREPQTTVIHAQVDREARVPGYESWWDVPVAEVTGRETIQSAQERYTAARQRQRFYY
jgi:3D-(3,5/4)-trihydroxycyclohexane-1,2-dione acylhydrolase (decyclizing)